MDSGVSKAVAYDHPKFMARVSTINYDKLKSSKSTANVSYRGGNGLGPSGPTSISGMADNMRLINLGEDNLGDVSRGNQINMQELSSLLS